MDKRKTVMGFVIYFAILAVLGVLCLHFMNDFMLAVIYLYLIAGMGMFFSWLFPEPLD